MLLASALAIASLCAAADPQPFIEQFDTLDAWQPFSFPRIKELSAYALGRDSDGTTYLSAISNASASALVGNATFNVYETPHIRWRWRVHGVYEKADMRTKAGDDSPLRVYVMFDYDPERASVGMRIKYAVANALYGHYPPHASLNYVWASTSPKGSAFKSPYTDRSAIIVKHSGSAEIGRWAEESADLLADYRAAFGEEPPSRARMAVMSDSDNTGERGRGDIDYIELHPAPR